MASQPVTSGHGGKRTGAGRKKKEALSPTKLSDLDLRAALANEMPDDLEALTEGNAKASIDSLVKVIVASESDPSRVTACCRLLDRVFGKPSVDLGGTLDLFGRAPPKAANFDAKEYARKFAALAVTVLQKIRDNSPTASARVAAAAALLDRELGTVAVAKISEGSHAAPKLGKREEVALAAERAATGIYSTPAAPGHEQQRLQ